MLLDLDKRTGCNGSYETGSLVSLRLQQHGNVASCDNMEQWESQPVKPLPNLLLSNEANNTFGLLMTDHESKSSRGFVFNGAINIVGLLVLVFLLGECEWSGLDGYVLSFGQ